MLLSTPASQSAIVTGQSFSHAISSSDPGRNSSETQTYKPSREILEILSDSALKYSERINKAVAILLDEIKAGQKIAEALLTPDKSVEQNKQGIAHLRRLTAKGEYAAGLKSAGAEALIREELECAGGYQTKLDLLYALRGTKDPLSLMAICKHGLQDPSPLVSERAVEIIRGTTDKDVLNWLITSGLNSDRSNICSSAAQALQGTSDQDTLKWLREQGSRNGDESLRCNAAFALQYTKDQTTIDWLMNICFESSNHTVRKFAVEALTGNDNKEVLTLLHQEGLSDPSASVRKAAARALNLSSDPDIFKALWSVDLINMQQKERREAAAIALHLTKDPAALKALAGVRPWWSRKGNGLKDPSPIIREACAFALQGCQDPVIQNALRYTLNDNSPNVRCAAIVALAGCANPRIVKALRACLKDRDRNVSETARQVLR